MYEKGVFWIDKIPFQTCKSKNERKKSIHLMIIINLHFVLIGSWVPLNFNERELLQAVEQQARYRVHQIFSDKMCELLTWKDGPTNFQMQSKTVTLIFHGLFKKLEIHCTRLNFDFQILRTLIWLLNCTRTLIKKFITNPRVIISCYTHNPPCGDHFLSCELTKKGGKTAAQ